MPWIKVKNLASYTLSRIAKRIHDDYSEYYGHSVYLLESFIDFKRFNGASYRAADWIKIGHTKGRSRNDRYNTLRVPIKDIYVLPLARNFRCRLTQLPPT